MKGLFIFMMLWLGIVADVKLKAPKSGQTYSGPAKIKIEWEDDGDKDSQFSLAKAKIFTISLCSGSSSKVDCLKKPLKQWDSYDDDDTSYTAEIDSDMVKDGYYFFQVYVNFGKEIQTIHYSNRFELEDMDGDNELDVPVTYTTGTPADQTQGAAAENVDSASFSIPYTKQTGLTRYAPMQKQPGSTVTASEWKRLFPTSDVTYFSTIQHSPKFQSTITPGWSYTIVSYPNYASPAPTPSVRYDPKERVTPASLSTANKRRRWLD